jgi:hypothetical protein
VALRTRDPPVYVLPRLIEDRMQVPGVEAMGMHKTVTRPRLSSRAASSPTKHEADRFCSTVTMRVSKSERKLFCIGLAGLV